MSIPKVIHYCWFGRNPLPESALRCMESWKKYCPDYEIRRWDEDNFSFEDCTYASEAYKIGKWSFVTDYARLKILYEYGGVYLDTDVELIRSIDPLLEYPAYFGLEVNKGEQVNTGLGCGAEKGNPIIKEMLDYVCAMPLYVDGAVNTEVLPKISTRIFCAHGVMLNAKKIQTIPDAVILPVDYLAPKDFATQTMKITKRTYSIHHYDASWFSEQERADYLKNARLRKVERIFGKRVYKLCLTLRYLFAEGGLREVLRRKLHR